MSENLANEKVVVVTQRTVEQLSGGFFAFIAKGLNQIATELSGDPKIALTTHASGYTPVLASGYPAGKLGGTVFASGAFSVGVSGNSFPVALYATTSGGGLSGINSLATAIGTSGIPVIAVIQGY